MRTKALVVMAAAVAMGVATATAQVVSVNVVGFINLPLKAGFNLIANQLDQLNGAAASNHINVVFPTVPNESQLLKFNAALQQYENAQIFIADPPPGAWYDNVTGDPSSTFLNPGEGAFFYVPADTTVTVVGQVQQGDNLTVPLPPHFGLASAITPQQLFLVTSNGFPMVNEMQYLTYNSTSHAYNNAGIVIEDPPGTFNWLDNVTGLALDVNPAVGAAFFIYNPSATTTLNWTRSFHVQ